MRKRSCWPSRRTAYGWPTSRASSRGSVPAEHPDPLPRRDAVEAPVTEADPKERRQRLRRPLVAAHGALDQHWSATEPEEQRRHAAWIVREPSVRLPVGALGIDRLQRGGEGACLAQSCGDPLAGDRVGEARRIADQKDAALRNRRCAIPEGAYCRDGANEVGVAQGRAQRSGDLPVARLEAAAELAHAILIAEQSDHPLIAGNRAFVDLEAIIEGDPHPGIDGRVHRPVGDDAVAVGRPGPDRPAEPMSERRPEAVGHRNDARSNLAGCGDHARDAAVACFDIARFRLRTELDLRVVPERVDQSRIERESADPESGLLTAVLRKGHGHGLLPGEPELDSLEWRRTAEHDRILQA